MTEMEKEPMVKKVVDRLAARYPEAPRNHIARIVEEEYDSLDHGRIKIYLPPLIEHSARNRLHSEFNRAFSSDLLDG